MAKALVMTNEKKEDWRGQPDPENIEGHLKKFRFYTKNKK